MDSVMQLQLYTEYKNWKIEHKKEYEELLFCFPYLINNIGKRAANGYRNPKDFYATLLHNKTLR